jgi:hypothetical protein
VPTIAFAVVRRNCTTRLKRSVGSIERRSFATEACARTRRGAGGAVHTYTMGPTSLVLSLGVFDGGAQPGAAFNSTRSSVRFASTLGVCGALEPPRGEAVC